MASQSRRSQPARRAAAASAGSRSAQAKRRQQASRQPARPGARARPRRRIGWARRVGIALGLLLVGGSLALAGGALELADPGGQAPSLPAAAPPPAPRLAPLEQILVATASADLQIHLPQGLTPRGEYRLRIYVNDELVREQRLPAELVTTVQNVPLEHGANRITAAIHGPDGEGLHSPALELERDDVAPVIHVTAPDPNRAIYTESVTVRGRSEPGAAISARNATTDQEYEAEADSSGRWELHLALATGRNTVTLRSVDAAGNRSRATLRLQRTESEATVRLEIQPAELTVEQLPASIRMVAQVRGLEGEPLDGAAVTFSLSVPGQQTLTYNTTSRNGVASWNGIRIPRDGARAGHGLGTVMAVLDDGQGDQLALQGSASIRFR